MTQKAFKDTGSCIQQEMFLIGRAKADLRDFALLIFLYSEFIAK